MKNKQNHRVLSEHNTSRMEEVLKRLPRPMTSGRIVKYLEERTRDLVPELIKEEGISKSTFISRLVNTAKYGKGNKIAVSRKKNGEANFQGGCGYQLYYDENKLDYTEAELEMMKHHAEGKDRPGARGKRNKPVSSPRTVTSEFVSNILEDAKQFESLVETFFSNQWQSLSNQERKETYLNSSSNIKTNIERMIFGNRQTQVRPIGMDLGALSGKNR